MRGWGLFSWNGRGDASRGVGEMRGSVNLFFHTLPRAAKTLLSLDIGGFPTPPTPRFLCTFHPPSQSGDQTEHCMVYTARDDVHTCMIQSSRLNRVDSRVRARNTRKALSVDRLCLKAIFGLP